MEKATKIPLSRGTLMLEMSQAGAKPSCREKPPVTAASMFASMTTDFEDSSSESDDAMIDLFDNSVINPTLNDIFSNSLLTDVSLEQLLTDGLVTTDLEVHAGGDGVMNPYAGGDGVMNPDAGGDGVMNPDVCVDGVMNPDACGDGVMNRDAGVDGVMNPDACGDGVMNRDAGGDGVMNRDAGGDGVMNRDAGGYGIMNPDAGCDRVMNPVAGGDGVMNPDAGGDRVMNPDAGGDDVMNAVAGGDGVMNHDAGGDRVMNPVADGDGAMNSDVDGDAHTEPPAKKRIRLSSDKIDREKLKNPLRDNCGSTNCKRDCAKRIPPSRREEIWNSYWSMEYDARKNWLFQNVDRQGKGRCTTGEYVSRRTLTYTYKLKDSDGISQNVCKTFFLTTLGYNKKNDRAVVTALTSPLETVTPVADKRGRHEPSNKIDRSVIREHVESFHPCISHYRRAHAPLRRYLPSDVNITRMYADFKEKHPDFKCGYDIYRGEVRNMNISFAKLGEEGCEICEDFKMNISSHNHCVSMEHVQSSIDTEQETLDDCQKCKTWIGHMRAARSSRKHYQTDAGSDRPLDTTVRSVDLQKVIMLPRMPGMKTAMFTPRIIAFHETFASVGKKNEQKGKKDNISVVWHEGIAGRKQEEIASTFVKALAQDRDTNHTVYWLDNCAAQNKNWCLFSTLVILVNGDTINNTDITLKYFERGHTFMSADSVHHGVEKEMSSKPGGNVYDFADFVNVVSASNSGHIQVIQVAAEDFRAWVGGQSTAKLRKPRPMLAELAQVQVRRGSRLLYYKRSHDDADFGEFDFLKKSFTMERPHVMRPGCRGISEQRKLGIVKKLCPLMPETRRDFWETLPVNGDRAEDNLDD